MSKRGDSSDWTSWQGGDNAETLQRYHTLFSAIDEGIYQLDAMGRFVALDEIICNQLGYAREELIGEHVSLAMDAADIEAVGREIRTLLTAESDDVATLDGPVRTATGDRLFLELRLKPPHGRGTFRGTVDVALDITDRHEREQTIREERALLNCVFEASPIGISALSSDGEIITLNDRAADIVGNDPAGSIGEVYDAAKWEMFDAAGTPISPEARPFGRVVATSESVTNFLRNLLTSRVMQAAH